MPELPEVEIVKIYLEKYILSHRIKTLSIPSSRLLDKKFLKLSLAVFLKSFIGKKIIKISRRGKYLLFYFNFGYSFSLHLGMSGKVIINQSKLKSSLPQLKNPVSGQEVFSTETSRRHIYLEMIFFNKMKLVFFDPRTFGKIILISDPDPLEHPKFKRLGYEPLGTPLKILFGIHPLKSTRKIKTFLLEQSFLAGLGNIYADESLHLSKVNPLKKSSELSFREWQTLVKNIRKILKSSIKNLGSSVISYRNPNNKKGNYQKKFLVYGRGNQDCYGCGSLLRMTRLGGRTTVYCEFCQK